MLVNFIDYATIVKNIPHAWRKIMRNNVNTERTNNIDKINKAVQINKSIRNIINKKVTVDNTHARHRWEKELSDEISNKNWSSIQVLARNVTSSSKLQWFHYRLTNRILTTNKTRNLWDNDISPLCYFCKKEVESYVHLFTECEIVHNKVWRPLERWLKYFCFIDFKSTVDNIILHKYSDSAKDMINTIILISKQYVYSVKCLQEELQFSKLSHLIAYHRMLEKYDFEMKGKANKHENKWHLYDLI